MFVNDSEPARLFGRPLPWFTLISITAFFAYGVDVDRFLTYNLIYSEIVSNPAKYRDTPLILVAESSSISVFHEVLSVALLTLELNAFLAVSLLVLTLWVGFLALKTHVTKEIAFLIVALVGMVSSGYFPGLDSSGLVFDRKSLVTFLLIYSIYQLTRKSFVSFVFVVAAGVALHPLNMIAGLAFLIPGYMCFLFFEEKKRLLYFGLGSLFFLLLIVALFSATTDAQDLDRYPIADWFQLAILLEVGDVALFDLIRSSIGINGVAIVLSMIVAWQNRENLQVIDYWCLSFAPLTALILVVEGLHGFGITFGALSEFFIIVQFRRGLWIVSVLALVQLLLYAFRRFSKEDRNSRMDLAVITSAVLVHSLSAIAIGLLYFLFKRCKIFGEKEHFIVAGSVLLIALQFSDQGAQFNLVGEILKIIVFAGFVMFLFLSLRHALRTSILICLTAFSGLVLANNNIHRQIFSDSWSRAAQGMAGTKEQILEVASYEAGEKFLEHVNLILELDNQKDDGDGGVLFSSRFLGYAGPVISDRRFIFSRWDNTVMFDRTLAAEYIAKLEDFGVDWTLCEQQKQGTACFLDSIQERISSLSVAQIRDLARKYDFKYVIRSAPLDETLVFETENYFVYRIAR